MPIPAVRNTPACETATPRRVGSGPDLAEDPSAATRSGTVMASTAAAAMPATPTQYAPLMPTKAMAAAPMNGPMNVPIRLTPPSVDRARARNSTGTASVRYFCRARLKTAADIPDDGHSHREQPESVANHQGHPGGQQGQRPGGGRAHDGPAFAELQGNHGRRQVEEPRAEPDQRDDQSGHGNGGAQFTGGQCHHRQDRALADAEQERGAECRNSNAAEAEGRRAVRRSHLLHPRRGPGRPRGNAGLHEARITNKLVYDVTDFNQTLAKLISVLSLVSGRGARTPTGHRVWFGNN
jgi:hypothetical protein